MDAAAPDPVPIADRLRAVRARIDAACRRAGRDPAAVSLVAVSKFQGEDAVRAALDAGQRRFGENRVQEATAKFRVLRRDRPELELRIIGALQTNKAADALAVADVIETLDRPRLADALDAAAQRAGRMPRLLVQVNIGDEPQKAGVATTDADRFILDCRRRFGAALAGLMAIPPADAPPGGFFRRLAALAREHDLHELSMGMSGDFEEAVAWGATSVRVGSAIFGDRPAGRS